MLLPEKVIGQRNMIDCSGIPFLIYLALLVNECLLISFVKTVCLLQYFPSSTHQSSSMFYFLCSCDKRVRKAMVNIDKDALLVALARTISVCSLNQRTCSSRSLTSRLWTKVSVDSTCLLNTLTNIPTISSFMRVSHLSCTSCNCSCVSASTACNETRLQYLSVAFSY